MKKKVNCIPCEVQGIDREATCEIYVTVIGDITYVCEQHRKEYIEEKVKLDQEDDG